MGVGVRKIAKGQPEHGDDSREEADRQSELGGSDVERDDQQGETQAEGGACECD